MNVDELASAFEAVPGGLLSGVERVRLSGGTDVVRLVPPPFQDEAAGRLRKLARAAAAMFGLEGPYEPEERWWRFVLQNTLDHPPSLLNRVNESVRMQGDAAVTATMRDAAKASARVVRKCRHLVRAEPPAPGKVDASPPSVEDAEPPAGRATRLTPAVALAGASFEWVCSERPNLVKMHSPGRRSPTKQQYEHIKEYGCEAYPGGEGESIPSFETWARHVRGYLKEKDGRVRSSRSGRTGRSIATPSEL